MVSPTGAGRRRATSQHRLVDLDGPRALLLRGQEGDAEVSLAGGAEIRPGRDEDAVLEQPLGEGLGPVAVGRRDPEVHRGLAAGDADSLPVEQVEEERALAGVK